MAREYVTLECTVCKERNYMTSRERKSGSRLELKKHCRRCRKHTLHKERRR